MVGTVEAPTLSDPVGIEIPPTDIPEPAGKLNRTTAGMLKLPSDTRASQWKNAPTGWRVVPDRLKLLPSIFT